MPLTTEQKAAVFAARMKVRDAMDILVREVPLEAAFAIMSGLESYASLERLERGE